MKSKHSRFLSRKKNMIDALVSPADGWTLWEAKIMLFWVPPGCYSVSFLSSALLGIPLSNCGNNSFPRGSRWGEIATPRCYCSDYPLTTPAFSNSLSMIRLD